MFFFFLLTHTSIHALEGSWAVGGKRDAVATLTLTAHPYPPPLPPADYNSVLDFPQYELHATMLANPGLMLHDKTGAAVQTHCPAPSGQCDVFDFGQPAVRALFIAECVNATQTGYVDGCFVDRAVDPQGFMSSLDPAVASAYMAGRTQMLKDLQTAVGAGPIVGNHAWGPPLELISANTGA